MELSLNRLRPLLWCRLRLTLSILIFQQRRHSRSDDVIPLLLGILPLGIV